ncbi:MAG: hypothetical protein ABWX81_06810, partial [Pseudolabrys sp.]
MGGFDRARFSQPARFTHPKANVAARIRRRISNRIVLYQSRFRVSPNMNRAIRMSRNRLGASLLSLTIIQDGRSMMPPLAPL